MKLAQRNTNRRVFCLRLKVIFSLMTFLYSTYSFGAQTLEAEIDPSIPLAEPDGFKPCSKDDLPDTPLRLVKDNEPGFIHAYISSYEAFESAGPNLSRIKRICDHAIYNSKLTRNSTIFSDYSWIMSPFRFKGKLYALVHNEYHANEHNGACAQNNLTACWVNSILLTTFEKTAFRPLTDDDLIAGKRKDIPLRINHPVGYFNPTNVVASGSGYFFAAHVLSDGIQEYGVCVFRSSQPGKPMSWKAWDGTSFISDLSFSALRNNTSCSPVSKNELGNISPTGLYHLKGSPFFVMIGSVLKIINNKKIWFVYASLSKDLISWSAAAPLLPYEQQMALGSVGYPSLVDSEGNNENFDTITMHPILYFVRSLRSNDRSVERVGLNLALSAD